MPKSATLAINERSLQLERKGRHIYRFGLGQSPFPVPDSVVKALQMNAHQKDYLQVQGLSDLRHAVAVFHQKTDNVDIQPENVMIGPGSKELMFLLQLTFYGELLIPSPCWVSYMPQAQILGRNIRLINTRAEENFCLSPKHLHEHCERENDPHRPRLLILNYPSNPTGYSYTEDELAEIAEIANHNNILVLSDEIYSQIHHEGRHRSIAQFYPDCTIV
ncbi:MAG: pyridoxal phosphate-dependent aminotransferase, partial [Fidelibacterota bacterium]